MRLTSLVFVLFSVARVDAGERMGITICNYANLPQYLVAEAEAETSFVFRSIDIEVLWSDCQSLPTRNRVDGVPWFIVRLRNDLVPRYGNELSLHAMGRAFVSTAGEGFLADVYYPAIKTLSESSHANQDALLGYTIAHEVGHLLLGPGHRPGGIMCARWSGKETGAISKRWLKFDLTDRVKIRSNLRLIHALASGD